MTYAQYKNPREKALFAKTLRKQAPMPERLLWNALSALRKETGLKFRRQHPIHPYVVDFACADARLAIELDGVSHDVRQVYDEKRDTELNKKGWLMMRFTNEDVQTNLEGVVLMIVAKAQERRRKVRLQ